MAPVPVPKPWVRAKGMNAKLPNIAKPVSVVAIVVRRIVALANNPGGIRGVEARRSVRTRAAAVSAATTSSPAATVGLRATVLLGRVLRARCFGEQFIAALPHASARHG